MKKPPLIRIGIDDDGKCHFWPYNAKGDDLLDEELPAEQALHLITKQQVPVELACCDPNDYSTHNYETLFTLPDGGTSSSFTLTKV